MPPSVPRKRLRDESPHPSESKRRQVAKTAAAPPPSSTGRKRKATLYDDLDASAASVAKSSKTFLETLDDSEDCSSLSDLSDGDFEEVPIAKRHVTVGSGDDDEDDDNEDIEFEDVPAPRTSMLDTSVGTGDLELTLHRDTRISLTNPFGDKKGPSKIERKVRTATHCVHVQHLLWHNAIRNAWLCDHEVQATLMSHIPPRLFDEVERWRTASGLDGKPMKASETKPKAKPKRRTKVHKADEEDSRDWGPAADRLEEGAVDMSHGDPLFRLMKSLSSWWKQRFQITAPGIRKLGYMSLERLDRLTKDILRALGLEARMVANLQPLGFGWKKAEDADAEKDTSTLAAVQRSKLATEGDSPLKKNLGVKKSTQQTKSKPPAKTTNGRSIRRKSVKDEARDSDEPDTLISVVPDSDEDSVVELDVAPSKPASTKKFDQDLEYPHYWTEVLSPVSKMYLPVDAIVKKVIATNRELIESLEPRGSKADKARQVMAYVVGYSQDGTAKDVTVRYLKRQTLPGRTKGMRMPLEKIPVHDKRGKIKRYNQFDWFKSALQGFVRGSRKYPITEVDEKEDSTDLKPAKPEKKEVKEGEETLQYYKQSTEFCLERHLKREEALLPTAEAVKMFRNKGKAKDKTKDKAEDGAEEPVYARKDVVNVKSAETWHKQGRAPRAGELPLKKVPYRAATTNRRRELAEAEAISGQKVLQGLYSFDQTDWIIPPPIKDGIIPKNDYGNIDLFAEHMCPEGAVHIPFRGVVKVCKRLQIDFAEAVVDFEFGHRMAVPVIQGVVVAEEHHDQVMEELRKDEAEKARKEDEKRRKEALRLWSKFLKGLRIVERIRQDYGHVEDDVQIFGRKVGGAGDDDLDKEIDRPAGYDDDPDMAGGFLPTEHDDDLAGGFLPDGQDAAESTTQPPARKVTSSFFPPIDDDEEEGLDDLIVDHGEDRDGTSSKADAVQKLSDQSDNVEPEKAAQSDTLPAPKNTQPRPKRRAAPRRSTRRRQRVMVSESEDEEEEEEEEEEDDFESKGSDDDYK
ncbi:DNA repair protein rhp42 [Verticillium alfalfae VaMs.102]|uniref:DNA repair protein rhp42 n=1 Tax=Verticillium alfalfae (strain VaMs.102 / ATCC MYA-4576 / FGSC 10136) TaxID=526221 RepID=C9SFX4_VERA1|nr:DNA repair protein rhp42 [Verticillium alfalfae VaMs.102]EEY17378.1 DNA repair protein rhp42 [Verticillium alfalfae VaMs.102]